MTTLLVTSIGVTPTGDWAFWAACFLVGAVVALALWGHTNDRRQP
jgi:hypothetical protein